MWLAAIAVVALLIGGAIWWLRRPVRHRNVLRSDFERFFRAWIPRLANGGLIFIKEEASDRFVQVALYKVGDEAVVHFGFPDADWSHDVFEDVNQSLRASGFDVKVESTHVREVPRFLTCDLDAYRPSVAQEISDIARTAFSAMRVIPDARFVVWSEGGVDPEALRQSFERLREHEKPLARKWANFWLSRLK
jgi:hypothetical protein